MIDIRSLNKSLGSKSGNLKVEVEKLVKLGYKEIDEKDDFYVEWLNYFVYCYGNQIFNNSANTKKSIDKIDSIYNIKLDKGNFYKFIFCLQMIYSLLLKLIVYISFASENVDELNKKKIENIIFGRFPLKKPIFDLWNEDFYCYLNALLCDEVIIDVNNMYSCLKCFNVNENSVGNYNVADEFKKMYETLFPKEIRHSLGEYYTPSWLTKYSVEYLKNKYNLGKNNTFIDPTCGAGVFLESIYNTIQDVELENMYGFDINTIAVITSKIVLLYNFFNKKDVLKLNIFQFDILMYPDLIYEPNLFCSECNIYIYGIKFSFPLDYIDRKEKMLSYIEQSMQKKNTLLYEQLNAYSDIIKKIYINLLRDRINGMFVKNIDVVLGNPPWINWEYLPSISKNLTKDIWVKYNMFKQNGKNLAFSKEDISLLVTYIVIDKLLKKEGVMGFIIRIGSFKSKQNGIGFRNFKIGVNGDNIKVLHVDDLSNINVFPGAINTACVAFFQKGKETSYPVSFSTWTADRKSRKINKTNEFAFPSEQFKNSLWLNTTIEKIAKTKTVLGTNNYKARTGVFTGGANAVYWIRIKKKLNNGNILIENVTERAKRQAPKVTAEIEPDLVYKLCRGFELGNEKVSNIYIICPHTKGTKMSAIDIKIMQEKYPLTLKYFSDFKSILDERKGFTSWERKNQKENFYAIQRIGEYTFKKYKVAWKYINKSFKVFILSSVRDNFVGDKLCLPSEKIMYVSLDTIEEAGYLAGILNTNEVRNTVESYMTETSISTHVLDKLKIPDYDINSELHHNISKAYLNNDFDRLNILVNKLY